MPLSLHSHSKRIECGFHLSRVSHYLFIDRIGWITMGKWIDERAWTVAMYICYILGFIVLSVAGYNYAMRMMGDTTLFMKVVVLLCICLFVALIVSLIFSIFITPVSELLNRLLLYWFHCKQNHANTQDIAEVNEEREVNTDNAIESDTVVPESNNAIESDTIVPESNENQTAPKEEVNADLQREDMKKEFMAKYVKFDCQELPIYEVFESLFDQEKSGAFAARAFKCAFNSLNWLKEFPGYNDAVRLFPHKDAIKGSKSNYSNANNNKNYSEEIIEETKSLLEDKLNELKAKAENQQN